MSKDILPHGDEGIFFIDDESSLLMLLKKVFSRSGYEVFNASEGKTAETIFSENLGTIELIILDRYLNNYNGMQLL